MFNTPIRSDDENAIELLKEKAYKLIKEQEEMKKANKYFRENNTMSGYGDLTEEKAIQWDNTIFSSYEKKPYATWQLSNNNQNINSIKKRIESLEKEDKHSQIQTQYDTEKYGFEVLENREITRLQLFFDDKPNENIRKELKSNGFKWSPTNNAWQRLLNDNARYSLRNFMRFMQRQHSSGMEM